MRAIRRGVASGALPAALLVTAALGVGTAAAPTPGVTCGSTITTDVTLRADLFCPSGDGIILGTNVTLDLGGHSLIGSGSGVGVQNSPGSLGGDTILNGTIENWGTGILLQASSPDAVPYTVSDVEFLSAPVSYLGVSNTLEFTHVTLVDSPIDGQLSGHIDIAQSSLTRSDVNMFFADATISDSTLVQSTVSANNSFVVVDSSRLDGKGVSALGSLSEGVIEITDSVVKNYAQPISGFWGGVTLTNNKFTDMANGVLGDISSNIASDGLSVIVGNTFVRSGVVLQGNVPMYVADNTFKQNEVGVIFTRGQPLPGDPPLTAEDSSAIGNTLTRNSGTGILTELSGLEVGDNTATKNGGYGIYAPGAVDLGGNVASGNTLGQCVGVVCTRK